MQALCEHVTLPFPLSTRQLSFSAKPLQPTQNFLTIPLAPPVASHLHPFLFLLRLRSFTETSSATPVTWHPLKPFAAVLDRQDRALVYDMGPYEATPKNGAAQAHPAAVDQPRMVLQHELQAQVRVFGRA